MAATPRHVHFELTVSQEAAARRHELLPRSPLRRLAATYGTEKDQGHDEEQDTKAKPSPYMAWLVVALVLAALVLSVGGYLWLRKNAKMRITPTLPTPLAQNHAS